MLIVETDWNRILLKVWPPHFSKLGQSMHNKLRTHTVEVDMKKIFIIFKKGSHEVRRNVKFQRCSSRTIFSSKVQFRKISQKWQLVNERKSLNFCYLRKPLGLKKDLWLWHTYQLQGTEICLFRHSGTTSMQDSVDIGPVSPNSSRQVGKEILLNVFIGIDMPWFPTLINLTPCWFQAKLSIRVSPKTAPTML